MLLISAVYKDSILSILFLLGVLFYMIHRKVKSLIKVSFILGIAMLTQYGLALLNLT